MNNKNKLLSVLSLVSLLMVLGAFWWANKGSRVVIRPSVVEAPVVEKTFQVIERLDYGGAPASVSAELSVKEGKTALELLENSRKITVKKYSFGSMVESIDGLTNGTGGKYWIYYVNGKAAEVGADQYKPQPGDQIDWKFEVSKY